MIRPQFATAHVRRVPRRHLAAVLAAALIVVATTGVVLAVTAGPTQYTGCLNKQTGVLYYVQGGTTPLHACLTQDTIATWSTTGPAGTAGAPGTNGTNGTNGAAGIAGKDGKDGLSGADGTNGAAGKDGNSVKATHLLDTDTRCGAAGGYEIFEVSPGPAQISVGVLCNGAKGDAGQSGTGGASVSGLHHRVVWTITQSPDATRTIHTTTAVFPAGTVVTALSATITDFDGGGFCPTLDGRFLIGGTALADWLQSSPPVLPLAGRIRPSALGITPGSPFSLGANFNCAFDPGQPGVTANIVLDLVDPPEVIH